MVCARLGDQARIVLSVRGARKAGDHKAPPPRGPARLCASDNRPRRMTGSGAILRGPQAEGVLVPPSLSGGTSPGRIRVPHALRGRTPATGHTKAAVAVVDRGLP